MPSREALDEYYQKRRDQFLSWAISDAEGQLVMRDWLGKPYRAGSIVCWPRNNSSILSMVRGTVQNISLVTRDTDYKWFPVTLDEARNMSLSGNLEWRVFAKPDLDSHYSDSGQRATLTRVENITSLTFLCAIRFCALTRYALHGISCLTVPQREQRCPS